MKGDSKKKERKRQNTRTRFVALRRIGEETRLRVTSFSIVGLRRRTVPVGFICQLAQSQGLLANNITNFVAPSTLLRTL